MKKNFIPVEEALELEELGFNDEVYASLYGFGDGTIVNDKYVIKEQRVFYADSFDSVDDIAEDLTLHPFHICRIPLWQQAFEFFREKYKIQTFFDYFYYDRFHYGFKWVKSNGEWGEVWKEGENDDSDGFSTYEEAQLECLRKLIEIVKNK